MTTKQPRRYQAPGRKAKAMARVIYQALHEETPGYQVPSCRSAVQSGPGRGRPLRRETRNSTHVIA